MLTNPSFSQAELATLSVPDFKVKSAAALVEAYERTKHMSVKTWKYAADDDMRDCLDQAAARTTGIDLATIEDWRARISREPTVTNEVAAESGETGRSDKSGVDPKYEERVESLRGETAEP